MNRKYDQQTMQLMAMFEQMTGSKLRDCFRIDDLQVFVVEKGQIGRAVGRGGANVKKLASALKSKIKIIEHSEDLAQFVKNTVHPIKPARVEVDEENKIATIIPPDLLSRGLLIGRQAIKLRETEKIVQRYFDLTELKVGRPEEGPQTVEEAQERETSGTKGKTATATIGDVIKKPKPVEEPASIAPEEPVPTEEPAPETSEEIAQKADEQVSEPEGPAAGAKQPVVAPEDAPEEKKRTPVTSEEAGEEAQASKTDRKTD